MLNVLIDTSVWVNHFKKKNDTLVSLLEKDAAMTHHMIWGELACGTPPEPRQVTLNAIQQLRKSQQITFDEVLAFIEREKLYGLGCGIVDITLLGSCLITPNTHLWTLDKRLHELAENFTVNFQV